MRDQPRDGRCHARTETARSGKQRRVTDPDSTACVRDGLPAIDTQPTSDPEEPFARPLVCAARGEEPFACHGIRPAWYLTRSDSTDPRVLGPYGVCH